MTRPAVRHPARGDIGRRIRVLHASFAGRVGVIVEAKAVGRGARVRVRLDHDEGYTWWFAARELEVLPDAGPHLRGVISSDPGRATGVPGASPP